MKSFSEIVQILKSKDSGAISALSEDEMKLILLTSDGAGKEVKIVALEKLFQKERNKAFDEWMKS